MPYRLFALSNFVSMLALLSYPLLVEPNLRSTIRHRVVVGIRVFACAAVSPHGAPQPSRGSRGAGCRRTRGDFAAPAWSIRLLWFGLAASASILLLAVTNHLTQDVAAIPFLWILPLAVYLLSFIICFESPRALIARLSATGVAALGFLATGCGAAKLTCQPGR